MSVQIVKDTDMAAVMSELRKNYDLVTGREVHGASDTVLLQQYVKLMYNVRVGLVLLLLRKDESTVLNDVRSLPLLTVIDKIKKFIFEPVRGNAWCGSAREQQPCNFPAQNGSKASASNHSGNNELKPHLSSVESFRMKK